MNPEGRMCHYCNVPYPCGNCCYEGGCGYRSCLEGAGESTDHLPPEKKEKPYRIPKGCLGFRKYTPLKAATIHLNEKEKKQQIPPMKESNE